MKKIGIYKIENVVNNKYYIGSSNDIDRRFRQHKRAKEKGNHLHRSIKKHGLSDFYFEVLEECAQEDLLKIEQQYLDTAFLIPHMIYNTNRIADKPPGTKGKKYSAETCAKMSAARKGRKCGPLSAEHRAKLSAAKKGRKYSAEHCAKLAAASIGNKHNVGRKRGPFSAEHCAKLAAARIGKTIHSFRNINTGEMFTGIQYDFYNKFGLRQSNVNHLIKGKRKSVKGWVLV